jgi:hypothetical protein
MAARIEPTPDQLQAAWLAHRKRSWPPTLAATLADPLYAALVRMTAVRQVLASQQAAPKAPTPPAQPPQPSHAGRPATGTAAWPPRRPAAAALDRKRAAAGDRDDD